MKLKRRAGLIQLSVLLILIIGTLSACGQWRSLPSKVENKPIPDSSPASKDSVAVRDFSASLDIGGLERIYHVHLPSSYNKELKWPLVIQLHGGGGEGKQLNALTGFWDLSDKEGFIVISPDAIARNWNDGRGDFYVKSHIENIDDVGFISAIIDKAVMDLNADAGRVYVTGISNGALMSHRLGGELSNKIAAIAPVAGNFPYQMAPLLSPSRPVPVIIINGTEDPLVPYQGGYITLGFQKRGRVLSVDDTVKFWMEKNGCVSNPVIKEIPDTADDGTAVTVTSYTGCRNGSDVILYSVKGVGHTWPGGLQYLSDSIIGRTCRDFNASQVIWEFFRQHPLK